MMNIYFVKAGKSETETFTQAFHIVNLTKKKIWRISKTKKQQKHKIVHFEANAI